MIAPAQLPWWGLLVRGGGEALHAELAAELDSEVEDDHAIVDGDGWTGLYGLRRESVRWDVADALRARGREVIVLELADEDVVHRWDGARWSSSEAEEPASLARSLGIEPPGSKLEARASRHAALVVGRTVAELRRELPDDVEVIAAPRGAVVLDSEGLDWPQAPAVTVFEVTHYLDDHEFSCSVHHLEDVAVFRCPSGGPTLGLPVLDEVEGETDPKNIVRKLGIPESFMFP